MQFERGKPPETPNAPYRATRIKNDRWCSAGPGLEPGRAGPWLSLRSSQDQCFCSYALFTLLGRESVVKYIMASALLACG
jgi:hypothetical protein